VRDSLCLCRLLTSCIGYRMDHFTEEQTQRFPAHGSTLGKGSWVPLVHYDPCDPGPLTRIFRKRILRFSWFRKTFSGISCIGYGFESRPSLKCFYQALFSQLYVNCVHDCGDHWFMSSHPQYILQVFLMPDWYFMIFDSIGMYLKDPRHASWNI